MVNWAVSSPWSMVSQPVDAIPHTFATIIFNNGTVVHLLESVIYGTWKLAAHGTLILANACPKPAPQKTASFFFLSPPEPIKDRATSSGLWELATY